MSRNGMTASLASWIASTPDVPEAVRAQGKRMILDQIACQVLGAPLEWSRAYRKATLALGAGSGASSAYFGDALTIDNAAFLNSAFGHANEYDDTHLASNTHPSAVIVPAAFALGEARGLSGARVLDAVIVGAEIMVRIAAAGSPALHARGHYTPAATGPFGAAAAGAHLLGFDPERALHALAIAGSHAAGLNEFTQSGGEVKRIHCAIPTQAGVRSAIFAEYGITGPRTVLEGRSGFYEVFAGNYDLAHLDTELGERYDIMTMSFKPYAANFSIHGAIEALGTIIENTGLLPNDVATIEIGISTLAVHNVGTIIHPDDVLGAQSSLAFSCAVRLLRGGNGPHAYRHEDLHDDAFVALANRVRVVPDAQCDEERARLKNRGAIVTVTTHEGRVFAERCTYHRGLPEKPLSDSDLQAKFDDAVIPILGTERAARLADRIWHLDELPAAAEIIALTRGS
jgi:2-methylcitrate dehydratase PrpD